MSGFRRFTPDMVVEAYRETRMGVTRSYYITDDKARCCGLGALLCQLKGPEFVATRDHGPGLPVRTVAGLLDVPEWYVLGFIAGFDGNSRFLEATSSKSNLLSSDEDRAYANMGFDDGRDAYDLACSKIARYNPRAEEVRP